jgi:outer membrane receptor protein involved in Fe transport
MLGRNLTGRRILLRNTAMLFALSANAAGASQLVPCGPAAPTAARAGAGVSTEDKEGKDPAGERAGPQTTDEVVVVTASRYQEQLLNAPATMSVVTEETINNAPIQNVVDLVRVLPGVNAMQASARDMNLATRAAAGTLADSMLVLLDGRSVYQDFFGIVLWDFIPVDSSEIRQIEVIRGPASAVWGANALTGVVNVITKTPCEMQGSSLSIRFGQFDRSGPDGRFEGGGLFSINAMHARATSNRFAYKISAGLLTQEPFLRPAASTTGASFPAFANRGTLQPRLDARVDYDFGDGGRRPEDQRKIVLAGGISGTEGIIHTGLGPLGIERGSTLKYGRLLYTRGRLKLQTFVNALDGEATGLLLTDRDTGRASLFTFEYQTYDIEASNEHLMGERHLLSYGGNYRYNNFDLSFAPDGTSRQEGGAYVQDRIFLSPHYRWIVGARLDRFSVVDRLIVSPRTAFLIKPRELHTIRLSFNRAFRAPSIINNFIDTSVVTQLDLGVAGPFSLTSSAVGNRDLREEELTAYEAGYIGMVGPATLGATMYFHRTKNMIQFTQSGHYTSADPPPGWPLPAGLLDSRRLPSQFTYRNFDRVLDRGVELSADVRVLPGVSGFVNYTWQADPKPTGFDVSELNGPPTHRFNVGASVTRGRYFGSVSGSYVGAEFWQDVPPDVVGKTRPYTLVDAGVGVHSTDRKMTVAVRARNLLNRPIQQHYFGDIIRRTLIGEVRFQL